jgi:uridine kinase
LFFVLCKAVHDLFRGVKVRIDTPVSKGYYVDLQLGKPVEEKDVERIRQRMQKIIDEAIPIHRYVVPTEEAIRMFEEKGDLSKVKLLKSVSRLYTTYYQIDDYVDYYYGALLTNTSQIWLFGLEKYYDGLLLRLPDSDDPSLLGEVVKQDKMFEVFHEHHNWQKILDINTVGDFNAALKNLSSNIIHVSEALQEKKFAEIALRIAIRIKPELLPDLYRPTVNKQKVRMVLIAGPSSSGKTTTCKRISVQLLTNGIKPITISLDDYFVDREHTPRDASATSTTRASMP